MDPSDRLHAEASELAQSIADRLARLEPETSLLADVDRLKVLLFAIIAETGRTE